MKRLIINLSLFLISFACFSSTPEGVAFSIHFYEKRIYYLDDKDHPVQIEAVITNNSAKAFRFKMANNRVYNLDFEVTTPTNLKLSHSKEFITAKHSNQPVLFREITLEPGEKYGIILTVSDFVHIEKPGLFSVQALFYPELNLTDKGELIKSNTLMLNIRPALVFPEEKALFEAETGKLLERKSIPPDEVVAYTLKARQKSQWEKFLLYLDLESLFLRKPERARSYRRMSEEDRKATLERFKDELKQQTVDRDILVIPTSFEIIHTGYTAFEATVIVTEKFQYPDYTEVKRYTYTLQRRNKIWMISDYEIQNLGTE